MGCVTRNQGQSTLTDEQFIRASQILKAMEQGYAKTPKYNPRDDPDKPHADPNYIAKIRQLCVEAVFSIWNTKKRATRNRAEIVPIVQDRVKEEMAINLWPREWTPPGRDTIIRRLNETADSRYYPGQITPCISTGKGRYLPNPQLFEETHK